MTIYGRSEELVSRCIECDLAEPESLASLGGSAPGLVDGILSQSILTILVGLPPTSYNLVHNYGQMSLQDVQAKALTYVGMQGREVQDSYMLYNFLIESLTDSFKAKVLLYKQDYTITPLGGQPAMKDRPTLLKRLIMLTYIDNWATTAHIRETLIDMAYQLTNLQGDITAFNDWVREQFHQLAA